MESLAHRKTIISGALKWDNKCKRMHKVKKTYLRFRFGKFNK